jgi:hypothetical protein
MSKARHPHDTSRPAKKSTKEAVASEDIEAVKDSLTVRQRRFCEEYVIDFVGKSAAIRSGYATKWADRQAQCLLLNEGVRYYIDFLTTSKANRIVSVDPDYVIQKIVGALDKGEAKGNLTAVLRACELLARHLGMLTDRQEITGRDGGPIEQKRIEEDAENFTNLLNALAEKAKAENKDQSVNG